MHAPGPWRVAWCSTYITAATPPRRLIQGSRHQRWVSRLRGRYCPHLCAVSARRRYRASRSWLAWRRRWPRCLPLCLCSGRVVCRCSPPVFLPRSERPSRGAHRNIRLVTGGVVFEDGVVLIIEGVSAAAGNVGAVEYPGSQEIEVRLAVIRIVGAEETNF